MMHPIMRMRRRAGISCVNVQDFVQAYLDGELAEPERILLTAQATIGLCMMPVAAQLPRRTSTADNVGPREAMSTPIFEMMNGTR